MGIFSKADQESRVTFEAREQKLSDIRNYFREILSGTVFNQKELTSILLAIEEACTNVIRHAYLYGPGEIHIKTTLSSDKAIFELEDSGRAFDFDATVTPDLERYVETGRKGGLGLYLIRKIMDDVSYFLNVWFKNSQSVWIS